MVITELKSHIEAWASSLALTAETEWHKAAQSLTAFIEGKQAEADAVALLQSKGYSVTPPMAAPSQAE